MHATYPSYLKLHQSGELARRAERAVAMLAECTLCARKCRVDRLHDPEPHAHCHTGRRAIVSSAFPHHGEEDCGASSARIATSATPTAAERSPPTSWPK